MALGRVMLCNLQKIHKRVLDPSFNKKKQQGYRLLCARVAPIDPCGRVPDLLQVPLNRGGGYIGRNGAEVQMIDHAQSAHARKVRVKQRPHGIQGARIDHPVPRRAR